VRGLWRAILLAVAAASGATALFLVLRLPPRTLRLGGPPPRHVAFGAYHIHTSRSDGTGTIDEVAAAAARAGLSFVILTDHGDGTRVPDAPIYRYGVLCIDAVEIGSDGGHIVALGLSGGAPYPLAGDPRDVVDDVHRMGGAAVLAHPDSPRPGLSFRSPVQSFDGIEWLNVDSEWRDDRPLVLARAALQSMFRAPEVIAGLFQRPARTLQRWDNALQQRRVFALAALDAHARITWRGDEEPRGGTVLARPSYEAMFRTVNQAVVLPSPLTGQVASDASEVLGAIRDGRTFSIISAFAGPAHLRFRAERDGKTVEMGGTIDSVGGPLALTAEVPEAPGAVVTLLEDGRAIARASGRLRHNVVTPGRAYRVEVSLPGFPTPWIVSNSITVATGPVAGPPTVPTPVSPGRVVPVPADARWQVERDETSTGAVSVQEDAVRLVFQLGAGQPHGQYAALVSSIGGEAGNGETGFDRVTFVARASRPMRISLQARLARGKDGERWRRSVYVDATPRTITVRLEDLAPVGVTTTRRPHVAPIEGLLVVVDTVNTKPGTAGELWISGVVLGVATPGGSE
jgi:hypothetical protein